MMDTNHLLLQAIIAPLIFSAVALAAGKKLKRNTGWMAFLVLLFSTLVLVYTLVQLPQASDNRIEAAYDWAPYVGKFTLQADGLSGPIAATIALLTTLIAVYSIAYMEHQPNQHAYYCLYLMYASGMIGTVLTTNLVAFFVFFEFMLLPSWALVGVWGTGRKEVIAFKYFMFTEAGALSLLAGIAATFSITGTFNVLEISKHIAGVDLAIITAIVISMLIGFFIKMAIFPGHSWLPDTHAEAPTPISALLSPAMIGIGGYAATRIVYQAFPVVLGSWQFTIGLSLLALITMVYGGLMALAQDDMKRLLAYSSISQMGYLLFGIASLSFIGLTGVVLLYVSHGLCKAVLFMVSGIFMHEFKTRNISDLRGLASRMPYTTVATIICFMGLAGVPPFLGFWGEIFVFAGSMYTAFSGGTDVVRVVVTAIAVIAAVFTAGYGLWTIRRIFYGEPTEATKEAKEGPVLMIAPIVVLVVLVVAFGIYPTFITEVIAPIANELIRMLTT